MGKETSIAWTDHTFNPWHGCIRVSPGCENCYAESLSKRWGHDVWGPAQTTARRTFGAKHWAEPLKWNAEAMKAGEGRRVFCASMADVFEDHPQLQPERERLWTLIEQTPMLDWLLLTKRPENVQRMAPWGNEWPQNVWLGTSVEDQRRANERLPILAGIPAAVKFISAEPLLEYVYLQVPEDSKIDWLITGGESGPGSRPFDIAWLDALMAQGRVLDMAVFVKQLGSHPVEKRNGRVVPYRLGSYKGDDPAEWPERYRVQEFPRVRRSAVLV